MIHYQVRCAAHHPFDGWFASAASFDAQAAAGHVTCPVCGDTRIERALMAPAIGRVVAEPAPPPAPPPPHAAAPPTVPAQGMPDAVRAVFQRLRHEVETRCENVGPDFADEARRIHTGQAPARGIFGETTPDQAEALADEGIEVSRIPWLPRSDS